MSSAIFFAPLRTPITDQRTGLMSREWYLFFQALFERVGGTAADTVLDVQQGPPEGPSAVDLAALQAEASQALEQLPPAVVVMTPEEVVTELRALAEQVAELTKRLQDLQQGSVPL